MECAHCAAVEADTTYRPLYGMFGTVPLAEKKMPRRHVAVCRAEKFGPARGLDNYLLRVGCASMGSAVEYFISSRQMKVRTETMPGTRRSFSLRKEENSLRSAATTLTR